MNALGRSAVVCAFLALELLSDLLLDDKGWNFMKVKRLFSEQQEKLYTIYIGVESSI
jgi:hypothetical protein